MPIRLLADIHCHLLPAWDDGPSSPSESLLLAAQLAQSGVQTAFVTPHVERDEVTRPGRLASEIEAAVEDLRGQVRDAGIPLELVPGAEVVLSPGLAQRLPDEPWLCLGSPREAAANGHGTRRILVELLPQAPWTPEVDALLFQIALTGVTPILAHPERYSDIQRDLAIARGLAGRGVLLQISAASLLARGEVGATARALMSEGLASFVASDAHSARGVVLDAACAQAEALLGEEGARQVLVENPRRLLEGREIVVTPRQPPPPRSLLSRWLGRT